MRRPDPRIAALIEDGLGAARTVVNVGAGTGSYEPAGRAVTAVEPSAAMIRRRRQGAAPAVQAPAEALPFGDGAFDAAMAVLTVHHWTDQRRGLGELRRVARRQVVLTWDPDFAEAFWLVRDYLPANAEIDRRQFLAIDEVLDALGGGRSEVVPIPHDYADGFLCAYWRRPEAYLDPTVRAGISSFARLDPGDVAAGLARLEADLTSGAFWRTNAALRDRESIDLGYRLLVTGD